MVSLIKKLIFVFVIYLFIYEGRFLREYNERERESKGGFVVKI